jgi:hypothetical protein
LHALYGNIGCNTAVIWENFGVGGAAFAYAAGID